MGVTILVGLGTTIVFSVGLHLFTNAIPKVARIAIAKAARRLPSMLKHNQEAAWLADFANLETHFEMLSCAVTCWCTSFYIRLPFAAERSHQALIRARAGLQAYGAIVHYALGRVKGWDMPSDAKKWSFCEKWCIGIIIASKAPIEERMKNYMLCLERDIEERPRKYKSQEEAVKELLMPIYLEIKIFHFLKDHDFWIDISVPR